VVILRNMGNIHPFRDGPIFERAHTVYVEGCDKNFVYYWCDERTFPSAIDVHLNSHPCDPDVLWRWHIGATIIWLGRRYAEYKGRWANNRDAVKIVQEDNESVAPAPRVI
jgi:hypothetical protein